MSSCLQHWLKAYETGVGITPPKRTQAQPYTASRGKWVVVEHMEANNSEGYEESYRPGDSAFVLGNHSAHPYLCGEPMCLVCHSKSKVQQGLSAEQARAERGMDMVECDRCFGAVHLCCESPPLDHPPEVIQLTQTSRLWAALPPRNCTTWR